MPAGLVAAARRGAGRANAPLTSRPVLTGSGSAIESVASPAVLTVVAVMLASYSRPMPGVNAPEVAGAPSVSASVLGTVPPTVACVQSERLTTWPHAILTVVVSSTVPSDACG